MMGHWKGCSLLLFAFALLAGQRARVVEAGNYVVMCYYTNWSQYRSAAPFLPENVQADLCTHILYAFADVTADSITPVTKEWNDVDFFARVKKLKTANPSLKILLALGGASSNNLGFNKAASSESYRRLFAANTVTFLRQHGFDGLDMDWEKPMEDQKVNFTLTLKALSEAFAEDARQTGRQRLLLTAALWSWKPVVEAIYEVETIHLYLDYLLVMAYDFHGTWNTELGHNSGLYVSDQQKAMAGQELLTQNATMVWWQNLGAPVHKLVMGLATYGRTFRMSGADLSQPGDSYQVGVGGAAGPVTGSPGHLSYMEVCSLLASGFTEVFDSSSKVPYAFGLRNGNWEWISYDNIQSMTIKSNYIIEQGLRGAMFWSLDQDDYAGTWCKKGRYPLISTVASILRNAAGKSTSSAPSTTAAPSTAAPSTTAPFSASDTPAILSRNVTTPGLTSVAPAASTSPSGRSGAAAVTSTTATVPAAAAAAVTSTAAAAVTSTPSRTSTAGARLTPPSASSSPNRPGLPTSARATISNAAVTTSNVGRIATTTSKPKNSRSRGRRAVASASRN